MAYPSDLARTKNWGTEVLTDSDLEGQFDLIIAWVMASLDASTGHAHTGGSNTGPKISLATGITIASQAQGDIFYASSASAIARLGAGTDGQYLKTQGAAANPKWANCIAKNYREGLHIKQASTTTIEVSVGVLEVNNEIINKTSVTTLTISTAGDYAGGSSLRATNTLGYVGVDASGNIKLHTTAPTHSDYALSITAGKKRFASWSSTTYRIIGWFRMNGTGSGELDSYGVSNISDMGARNVIRREYTAQNSFSVEVPIDDTIPQNSEMTELMVASFVSSDARNKVRVKVLGHVLRSSSGAGVIHGLYKDAAANASIIGVGPQVTGTGTQPESPEVLELVEAIAAYTYTEYSWQCGIPTAGNTHYFNGSSASRLFGGVLVSFIEIEELERQGS